MAVNHRSALALAGVIGVAALSQGCVSYDLYDKKVKEAEANKAAYMGADTAVGNAKKENELLKLRMAAMERELGAARERQSGSDLVVDAKYQDLKRRYEEMLASLRDEQGGEWTINAQTGGVVLEESVYFAPGRAELKSEKFGALDALIAKLRSPEFGAAAIEVGGHTDSDPISRSAWKDNFQLSAERARAVLVYFMKKGIEPDRVFLSGYGPTRPRGDKKADNRRVEIVLHERS